MAYLYVFSERLTKKGVAFKCIQQSGADTDASTGRLMLGILGAVAAFDTDLRKEPQREGIEKAKANGVNKGRKPTVDTVAIRPLCEAGVKPVDIAKRLKIGRASIYRALEQTPE